MTGDCHFGIGNKQLAKFDDTPFLLHAKFDDEDPNKAVIKYSGFNQSNGGRTGYVDNKGNVYVRTKNKLVTSNKDCTQADLFVNDPNLLCRYLADIGTERHVITAAKKTAQKISEAEKTAARIKELEAKLSQRDTTLLTFKKYLKGDECSWDMEQSLKKVPENVRGTFSKIEKIYSILFAQHTLLGTNFTKFIEEDKKLREEHNELWEKYGILLGRAHKVKTTYGLSYFGLRYPRSKKSQVSDAIEKLPTPQKSTITPCHGRNRE